MLTYGTIRRVPGLRREEVAKMRCAFRNRNHATLAVLALKLHASQPDGDLCTCCGLRWPCDTVRLAYRLREGF